MTIDAIGTTIPTVFDAGLPPIAYEHAHNPDEAHRLIRQARLQGPIALGPHGPEVLSYELVRTVLRDPRFSHAEGRCACQAQGITSGPLWDKAITGLLSRDGADHNRLRRLVSKAFTPRSTARLSTTIVRGHHRAGRPGDQCGALRRGRRHRTPVSDPDHLRVARRTAPRLATVLRLGRRHLQGLHLERRQRRSGHHGGLRRTRRLRRRHGRPAAPQPHRRPDSPS